MKLNYEDEIKNESDGWLMLVLLGMVATIFIRTLF